MPFARKASCKEAYLCTQLNQMLTSRPAQHTALPAVMSRSRIYIGNLPSDCRERELEDLFEKVCLSRAFLCLSSFVLSFRSG